MARFWTEKTVCGNIFPQQYRTSRRRGPKSEGLFMYVKTERLELKPIGRANLAALR